jgi:hypothetical protein
MEHCHTFAQICYCLHKAVAIIVTSPRSYTGQFDTAYSQGVYRLLVFAWCVYAERVYGLFYLSLGGSL